MNRNTMIYILVIMVAFSIFSVTGFAETCAVPAGDWIINTTLHCENQEIELIGNLTIEDTGSLTLDNVSLNINATYNGSHKIEVKSGGALYIVNFSNISNGEINDASYLFKVNSNTIFEMRDSELHKCGYNLSGCIHCESSGLQIFTKNVIIENSTFESNYVGIILYLSNSADNAIITNNRLVNNEFAGIFVGSNNNTISYNNISYNNVYGIRLQSDNNTLINNTVSNNFIGFVLSSSNNNIIMNNTISYSLYLDSYTGSGMKLQLESCNNTIGGNRFTNSITGLGLHSSSNNNLIYNNYFANNNVTVADDANNYWNTTKTLGTNIIGGPYIGGNYWNKYNGLDIDGDGLGDTFIPYNSAGDILVGGDYLPLTNNISDNNSIQLVCANGQTPENFEWSIQNVSISPNLDNVYDYVTIFVSKFNQPINYTLDIKQNSTILYSIYNANKTQVDEEWYGNNSNGTVVEDGVYEIELFAEAFEDQLNNITKTIAYVTVDNTPAEIVADLYPEIIYPDSDENNYFNLSVNFSENVSTYLNIINPEDRLICSYHCGGKEISLSSNGTFFEEVKECERFCVGYETRSSISIIATCGAEPIEEAGCCMGVMISNYTPKTGNYTLSITSRDKVGNIAEKNLSFIIIRNDTTYVKLFPNLTENQSVAIEVPEIHITDINFTVNKNLTNAIIIVNETSFLPSEPSGTRYRSFEIEKVNIQDEDIENIKIRFRVKRSWIDDNNIKKDKIYMMRYSDAWNKLSTAKLSEDSIYYYYEAESPGFSYFAVTGEENEPVDQPPSRGFVGGGGGFIREEPKNETEQIEEPEETSEETETEEETVSGPTGFVIGDTEASYLGIIVVVLLIVAGIYFYKDEILRKFKR